LTKLLEKTLENFGDRLAYVLHVLDLTQAYIAENAGVTQGAVAQWMTKKDLSRTIRKKLIFLKSQFNVDLDWLSTGAGTPFENEVLEPLTTYAGIRGKYSTAEEVIQEDWAFVKRTVQENNHIKIFRVIGDSMAPTLWDTDLVFCFPHDKEKDPIKDTHIYVIESIHHGLLIKRIVNKHDGHITVYGDNRAVTKPFPLNLHKEVLSLWRVRTRMTWQLGAPPLVDTAAIEELQERIRKLENLLK